MPATDAGEQWPDWPNLPAMMFALAARWPERPMLRAHRAGAWRSWLWGEFAAQAAAFARALRARGVAAGDRVLIVSENRPEFFIAETALMALGAVPVPTYVTNTPADHAFLLADCGARAAIVSTPALAARLPRGLDLLVLIEGAPLPGAESFASLATPSAPPADIAEEARAIAPETLACLIYTSGTGGSPKGVMLPHRALLANCRGALELVRPLRLGPGDVYLSFLPLSHSFEHLVGQFFLPAMGAEIVFSRGAEHLAADLREIRPTIMTMVPRLLEVLRARILHQLAREPGWKQALFRLALANGERRVAGRPLGLARALLDPALERLVRRPIRARFGGRLRAAISGGARLEPETGRFFLALGLTLMQGYGQTEAGPVIAANPPDAIRIETVGRPLAGVEVRIAPDGEIMVRGDLVMLGYWNRPEATAAALHEGWLATGDIGTLSADNYLTITDRKKDIIVLSGGENISPARLEGMLAAEPEIAQAVVAGDGQTSLAALIVPAEGTAPAAVEEALARVNARLSPPERIRRHRLVPAFTLENGLLTPTHKIRRTLVLQQL
ncbi:MAG: AMP-dependent synthetase/ligase, partial [Acetobacteraceae bacterium]